MMAGLAFLTHPMGIVAAIAAILHMLIKHKITAFRKPEFYAFSGVFLVFVLMWVVYASQDWMSFRLQMQAQATRKQHPPPYWYQFYMQKNHVLTLPLLLIAGVWVIVKKHLFNRADYLSILAALVFAAATYGREMTYFSYFIPVFCVLFALAAKNVKSLQLSILMFGLAYANEIALVMRDIHRYNDRNYALVAKSVKSVIPENATVFLGFTDVSPYFALYGRNPMRSLAPVPPPVGFNVKKDIDSCDYLVTLFPVPYADDVREAVLGKQPILNFSEDAKYKFSVFKLH